MRPTPVRLAFDVTRAQGSKLCDTVVMHGMLGSRYNFRSLSKRKEMSEHSDVWLVDMRNHGSSPHADSMTQEDLAADLVHFLDCQQIESAVLLGHSMGGKAAMKAAFDYPARVRGLVICDIGPFDYKSLGLSENPAILKHMHGMRVEDFSDRKSVERSLLSVVAGKKHVVDFLMTNLLQDESGRFRWRVNLKTLEQYYEEFSGYVPSDTDRFDGPVQVIYGTQSEFMPPDRLHEFGKYFPQFDPKRDLKPINGGHLVHFADPERFLQYVEEFNRRLLGL